MNHGITIDVELREKGEERWLLAHSAAGENWMFSKLPMALVQEDPDTGLTATVRHLPKAEITPLIHKAQRDGLVVKTPSK